MRVSAGSKNGCEEAKDRSRSAAKPDTAVIGKRQPAWSAHFQVLLGVSEVCLQVDPGAVVGDGGGGRAGVQEQPRRQELRGGWQVGGDLLLEHRA